MLDSTKFTTWRKELVEFHLLVRVTSSLYPSSISFGSTFDAIPSAIAKGKLELLADAWYDDNKSFRIMFEYGYNPIVKPNKDRWKGYHRKKARKLLIMLESRSINKDQGVKACLEH